MKYESVRPSRSKSELLTALIKVVPGDQVYELPDSKHLKYWQKSTFCVERMVFAAVRADFPCFSFRFFREPYFCSEAPFHRVFLNSFRCIDDLHFITHSSPLFEVIFEFFIHVQRLPQRVL